MDTGGARTVKKEADASSVKNRKGKGKRKEGASKAESGRSGADKSKPRLYYVCSHVGCDYASPAEQGPRVMLRHEARFRLHAEHKKDHGKDCGRCQELVTSGEWTARGGRDDFICRHVGCGYYSSSPRPANRKQAVRRHESAFPIHYNHFCNHHHECELCKELLSKGVWAEKDGQTWRNHGNNQVIARLSTKEQQNVATPSVADLRAAGNVVFQTVSAEFRQKLRKSKRADGVPSKSSKRQRKATAKAKAAAASQATKTKKKITQKTTRKRKRKTKDTGGSRLKRSKSLPGKRTTAVRSKAETREAAELLFQLFSQETRHSGSSVSGASSRQSPRAQAVAPMSLFSDDDDARDPELAEMVAPHAHTPHTHAGLPVAHTDGLALPPRALPKQPTQSSSNSSSPTPSVSARTLRSARRHARGLTRASSAAAIVTTTRTAATAPAVTAPAVTASPRSAAIATVMATAVSRSSAASPVAGAPGSSDMPVRSHPGTPVPGDSSPTFDDSGKTTPVPMVGVEGGAPIRALRASFDSIAGGGGVGGGGKTPLRPIAATADLVVPPSIE